MVALRKNRATGLLDASLTNVATSLTLQSGQGALFPAIVAPDYFWAVLEQGSLYAPTQSEIIKVTARSGDTFGTIVRAQQGTTALAFNAGDRVELRLTRDGLLTARNKLIETTMQARMVPPSGFMGSNVSQTNDPWGIFNTGAIAAGLPVLATTNQRTGQHRGQTLSTSTATGQRGIDRDVVFRGNAAGEGGFHFEGKCALGADNASTRFFIGLNDSTGALEINTVNPGSYTGNSFGFGFDDSASTGSNFRFFHGSGSTTSDDTGIARQITNLLYWQIHAESNASSIRFILKDLTTGTTFDVTQTTNLPSATAGMVMQQSIKGNGAGNSGTLDISYANGWPFARPFPW